MPRPQHIVCRLTAPLSLMHECLRMREQGMFLDQSLTRAEDLADILERATAEDFAVENGLGPSVGAVEREVLSLVGCL